MKNLGLAVCIIMLFSSCSRKDSNNCTINLSLSNGNGKNLCLYELKANVGEVFVDSAVVNEKGKISFVFKVDTQSLFVLKTPEQEFNGVVLLPSAQETLYLEADYKDLALSVDVDKARPTNATLNYCTYLILPFQTKLREAYILNESVTKYWEDVKYTTKAEHIHDSLTSFLDSVFLTIKEEAVRLGSLNECSLIPVYVSQQVFGNRAMFNIGDDKDFELLSLWSKKMISCMPANAHALRFKFNISRLEKLHRIEVLQRAKANREN